MSNQRVKMLSLAEEGAYRLALDSEWREGSIPSNPKALALMIGKRCTDAMARKILSFFIKMPGHPSRAINVKLERIRAVQKEKYEKKVKGGRARAEQRERERGNKDGGSASNATASLEHRTSYSETDSSSYEEDLKTQSVFEDEIQIGEILAGVTKELQVQKLSISNLRLWENEGRLALENGRTAAEFVECFVLLRKQQWRNGPVKPSTVTDNLPNLAKLRTEIAIQNKNGVGETLPTAEQKKADDAVNTAAMKLPPKPITVESAQ